MELCEKSLAEINSSTSLASVAINDLLYLQISIYFGVKKQIRCIFRAGKDAQDQEEIVRNWKCDAINKPPTLAPGNHLGLL